MGLHKTASSSIQKTLFMKKNNKLLEEKGFLYPRCWYPNHSVPMYSTFCDRPEMYHINIKNEYSLEEINRNNKQYLNKLKTEIARRQKSSLIISGEAISLLSADNLFDLQKFIRSLSAEDVTFQVIIYVRNPLTWLSSTIQQSIKGGTSYQKSIATQKIILQNLFRSRVGKFIQVFGKESINVFSFEEAIKFRSGPVGHFLSALGFNSSEITKFNILKANERMSLVAGDLLSFINSRIPSIKNGKLNKKRSNGDHIPFFNIKGPKYEIPNHVNKEIFDISQEDMKWLKENYGINYLTFTQSSQIKDKFTKETLNDIKKIYKNSGLSNNFKRLIIEYIANEINSSSDKRTISLLRNLLIELNH